MTGQNREKQAFFVAAALAAATATSASPAAGGASAREPFPERGMYFATHFRNWYEEAPEAEVERYVEDLAEWGLTGVAAWFDMHDFASLDDPGARRRIDRVKLVFRAAERLGLRRDLLFLANEAFAGSPEALRADWKAGKNGYKRDLVGHYHVELCPSKPGAAELLLDWRRAVFAEFADTLPTDVTIFPYDQGGCTCDGCAPWGANGFLRLARPLASLAREAFPGVRVNLSTWNFDSYGDTREWAGLFARGGEVAEWADRLYVAPRDLPRVRDGAPGGLPVFSTTEISMQGMLPWGGWGANPMPARIQREIAENPGVEGLRPYSEGIYEDLNKAMALGVLRDPTKATLDVAGDYAARHFGEAAREPVKAAVALMEENMGHSVRVEQGGASRGPYALGSLDPARPWRFVQAAPKIDRERALRAKALMDEAERAISPEAAASWRFRLLRLRADLDAALAEGAAQEALEPMFREIARIGRVSDATPPWLVPPSVLEWTRIGAQWRTCL